LKRMKGLVEWWFCTVVMSFLPIIFSMIASFGANNGCINLAQTIGDCELILSSFLLPTTSLINIYKSKTKDFDIYSFIYFMSALLVMLIEIVVYIMVKIYSDLDIQKKIILSVGSVLFSLITSYSCENYIILNKENEE